MVPTTRSSILLAAAVGLILLSGCGSSHHGDAAGTATNAASTGTRTAPGAKEEPGGSDNNVAEYGRDATPTERTAIASVVSDYYAAGAALDGSRACPLLDPQIEISVVEDYGSGAGPRYARGKSCAIVLSKIFKHLHPKLANTTVTGVRVKGDNAFAEIHNAMTPNGAIDVQRRKGVWRLGNLMAHEIPARFLVPPAK